MWRQDDHAEMERVTAFMQTLGTRPLEAGPLPDPAFLWWKAQLLRRWDAQQKAAAPLDAGDRVEAGAGVVAGVLLLVWLWRSLPVDAWPPAAAASVIAAGILLAVAAGLAVWTLRPRA